MTRAVVIGTVLWLVGIPVWFALGVVVTRHRWRSYHVKAVAKLSGEVLALQRRPRQVTVTRIGPPLSGLRVDIDGVRYSVPSVDWTERCDRVADVLVLHFKLPADPDPGRPLSSALVDDNPDLEPVHMPPGWTSSPLPSATGRAQLRAVPAPTNDPYRV